LWNFMAQDSLCRNHSGEATDFPAMLTVHYSNRTEELLNALAVQLSERRRRGVSPLEPAHLVIPNRNVESYVKLGLASRLGIAANLQGQFLRHFLSWRVCAERPEVQPVDAAVWRGALLRIFLDDALLAHPELDDVVRYLHSGGSGLHAREVRAAQLSGALSKLFEEYAYSRHDWLSAWPKHPVLQSTTYAQTERWERRLYLMILGAEGLLEQRGQRTGQSYESMTQWLNQGAAWATTRLEVHLFGLSYVGRTFMELLALLPRGGSQVHVYTLNPCREFWEDVTSDREQSRRRASRLDEDDPFGLGRQEHPMVLRAWGRPGRENVRLLNELTECTFEDHFPDEADFPRTLLGQVQRDIMTLKDAPMTAVCTDDASIRVLGCPSVRREAETIAAEIWRAVRDDPGLKFNEIGVMVGSAQKDVYLPQLAAVFAEAQHLPCTLVDLPASAVNGCVQAAEMMLHLPLSDLSRQKVLDVVLHPAVMAAHPDASRETWVALVDRLGIFHGASQADFAGTYVDGDVFNWDQGLRRLAFGAFMAGERSGDLRPVTLEEQEFLPEELAAGDGDQVAWMSLLLRSLVHDVQFARTTSMTLQKWSGFLCQMVLSYFDAATPALERDRSRCLTALRSLEAIDTDGFPVAYRVAHDLALEALAGLPGNLGHHLAEGVVVSSLAPMRAVPFKVIFLAGMGEGLFPSTDENDPLDLRHARPRPGDVGARDQDRYVFLESLLCARQRLYLSYVNRDALTGERLSPSTVIRELMDMVEQRHLRDGRLSPLERSVPLYRHQDSMLESPAGVTPFPEARAEAQSQQLRQEALAVLGSGMHVLPSLQAQRSLYPPAVAQWLKLPEVTAPPRPTGPSVHNRRVPLFALKSFLECPLQGYARFVLHLEEEDKERAMADGEPFHFSRMSVSALVRDVFVRSADTESAEHAYDEAVSTLRLKGAAPVGFFGDSERAVHLGVMEQWRRVLTQLGMGNGLCIRRLGGGHGAASADQHVGELLLETTGRDGRAVQGVIHGRTAPFALNLAYGATLKVARAIKDRRTDAWFLKHLMRAFVDVAVLAAAGQPVPHGSLVVIEADRVEQHHRVATLTAPGGVAAREWLTHLLHDLLNGPHAYFLPCEAVFALQAGDTAIPAVLDDLRADGVHSSAYGPVPHAEQYPTPPNAEELMARRWGLFLESVAMVTERKERS
jgi:exodeoxyribonuclease V gamma subunit